MHKSLKLTFAALALISVTACKANHDTVVKEKKEAQQEVQKAEQDRNKVVQKDAERIDAAKAKGDTQQVEKEKINASKDLADANKKVGDEKAEGTKEITDAEKSAGETTGTLKHE